MRKCLLCAVLFVANLASAYELTGKVIKIADGDTLTVLDAEHNQRKIRLADIDASESGQPYGKRAKQHLQALAAGKNARTDCREKDRYKRDVCTVYVDGVDLNVEMVQSGHAWVYERYNRRDDLYALQEAAKKARKGLWGLPEAQRMNPAEWRRTSN